MLKHYLYSQNEDKYISTYPEFNHDAIKAAIVAHLTVNPKDCIEHQKEVSKTALKRLFGNDILAFYEVNPKDNKVSRAITKGKKTVYVPITK
jgi:hypothetical protein